MKTYIEAKVTFRSPAQGGRPCVPVGNGFAPYIRAADLPEDLAVRLNGMPLNGQHEVPYTVELELSYHPTIDYSPIRLGARFQLIEGPRVIGEGIVTSDPFQRPENT